MRGQTPFDTRPSIRYHNPRQTLKTEYPYLEPLSRTAEGTARRSQATAPAGSLTAADPARC